MQSPILELNHITKTFPGVTALDDVHFDIHPGEVHALLGENGAGKSTLIKIASGVYQPDAGEILVQGETVRFGSPHDAQAHGIATIYQELLLYPELSVAENIFMGHAPRTRLGAVDWPAMRTKAQEILASLNIYDMDVTRKGGSLTVGNRQRVEIAKALAMNARVLIMDEPTAAITEADVERLFSTIELLKERQVGIVYISHRLNEVFVIGDRVTVLRDGRYVGTEPMEGMTEDRLVGMMVGRTIDNMFPKLDVQPGEVVLEVRGLTRGRMVRDVSFQIRQGEIVGMAGLVGAGRSETAQTISASPRLSRGPSWSRPRSHDRARRGHAPRDRLPAGGPSNAGPDPAYDLCENNLHDHASNFAGHVHQPPEGTGAGPVDDREAQHPRLQSLPLSASCRAATNRKWWW